MTNPFQSVEIKKYFRCKHGACWHTPDCDGLDYKAICEAMGQLPSEWTDKKALYWNPGTGEICEPPLPYIGGWVGIPLPDRFQPQKVDEVKEKIDEIELMLFKEYGLVVGKAIGFGRVLHELVALAKQQALGEARKEK